MFRRCQCSCTMILPPRIDQNVMGSRNIQSKVMFTGTNISGNILIGLKPMKRYNWYIKRWTCCGRKETNKKESAKQFSIGTIHTRNGHLNETTCSTSKYHHSLSDVATRPTIFFYFYIGALDSNFNISKTKRSFI